MGLGLGLGVKVRVMVGVRVRVSRACQALASAALRRLGHLVRQHVGHERDWPAGQWRRGWWRRGGWRAKAAQGGGRRRRLVGVAMVTIGRAGDVMVVWRAGLR